MSVQRWLLLVVVVLAQWIVSEAHQHGHKHQQSIPQSGLEHSKRHPAVESLSSTLPRYRDPYEQDFHARFHYQFTTTTPASILPDHIGVELAFKVPTDDYLDYLGYERDEEHKDDIANVLDTIPFRFGVSAARNELGGAAHFEGAPDWNPDAYRDGFGFGYGALTKHRRPTFALDGPSQYRHEHVHSDVPPQFSSGYRGAKSHGPVYTNELTQVVKYAYPPSKTPDFNGIRRSVDGASGGDGRKRRLSRASRNRKKFDRHDYDYDSQTDLEHANRFSNQHCRYLLDIAEYDYDFDYRDYEYYHDPFDKHTRHRNTNFCQLLLDIIDLEEEDNYDYFIDHGPPQKYKKTRSKKH